MITSVSSVSSVERSEMSVKCLIIRVVHKGWSCVLYDKRELPYLHDRMRVDYFASILKYFLQNILKYFQAVLELSTWTRELSLETRNLLITSHRTQLIFQNKHYTNSFTSSLFDSQITKYNYESKSII